MGMDVFRSDVPVTAELDDCQASGGPVQEAEELMADADQAFFSTCGSSLSVRTAIMATAGPGEG